MTAPDFDWNTDDSVVLVDQPTTAIYTNGRGQIVIRQEASPLEDEDSFVFIDPLHARAVAQAILNAAALPAPERESVPVPPPAGRKRASVSDAPLLQLPYQPAVVSG